MFLLLVLKERVPCRTKTILGVALIEMALLAVLVDTHLLRSAGDGDEPRQVDIRDRPHGAVHPL